MFLKIVGVALTLGGCLVIPLFLLVAWGTAMDMDPPYAPVAPWLWASLAGVAMIYVGVRVLRFIKRGVPEPPYPRYW